MNQMQIDNQIFYDCLQNLGKKIQKLEPGFYHEQVHNYETSVIAEYLTMKGLKRNTALRRARERDTMRNGKRMTLREQRDAVAAKVFN